MYLIFLLILAHIQLLSYFLCNFPTDDCSNINGNLIHISEIISISDVRLIKWLTGYTVDANFFESYEMSEKWVTNKSLILKRK